MIIYYFSIRLSRLRVHHAITPISFCINSVFTSVFTHSAVQMITLQTMHFNKHITQQSTYHFVLCLC